MIPVEPGDKIKYLVNGSNVTKTIIVSWIEEDPEGNLHYNERSVDQSISNTLQGSSFNVRGPKLHHISVYTNDSDVTLGVAHIVLGIARANQANLDWKLVLAAGPLTNEKPIVWPGSGTELSSIKLGRLLNVEVSNPSAGNNFSTTIGSDQIWQIMGMRVKLVTDATAATRSMVINLNSTGTNAISVVAATTVPASTTQEFHFLRNAGQESNATNIASVPLPDMWLTEGNTIQSRVQNIQSGDQLSEITLWLEKRTRRAG